MLTKQTPSFLQSLLYWLKKLEKLDSSCNMVSTKFFFFVLVKLEVFSSPV